MRRLLMLLVLVAMLAVSIPALAAPPDTPNDNAWTEIGPGHFVNKGAFKGNAIAVRVYESGSFDGMETLLTGPATAHLDDVPCPKDTQETDPGTWWSTPPGPPGYFACHHFAHPIPIP